MFQPFTLVIAVTPTCPIQALYILYLMLNIFLSDEISSRPEGQGRCSGWNGSYFRPFVPIKPSSLPFRQSLQTNGGHNYSGSGPNKGTTWAGPPDHFPLPFAQQFQFPKLSYSPTTDHHRTLPPGRNTSQRKAMIITCPQSHPT